MAISRYEPSIAKYNEGVNMKVVPDGSFILFYYVTESYLKSEKGSLFCIGRYE